MLAPEFNAAIYFPMTENLFPRHSAEILEIFAERDDQLLRRQEEPHESKERKGIIDGAAYFHCHILLRLFTTQGPYVPLGRYPPICTTTATQTVGKLPSSRIE